MRNLLRANLRRMLRNKCFLFCALAMLIFPILVCINQRFEAQKFDIATMQLSALLVGVSIMCGPAAAVFTSLFLGVEYADGTIRNKLIAGKTRSAVYLANVAACALGGLLLDLIFLASALGAGLLLLDRGPLSAAQILPYLVLAMLGTILFAALFAMMAMLISQRAVNAILSILLVAALFFAAGAVYSILTAPEYIGAYSLSINGEMNLTSVPNPKYPTPEQRAAWTWVFDLLPSGQMITIVQQMPLRPLRMTVCLLAETALITAAGLWLFGRKNLK